VKAKQTLTQIAQVSGRSCNSVSREVKCGRGDRGYRAEQACVKATKRAKGSRNAQRIPAWVWPKVAFYLGVQWISVQIAHELPLSHESVYLHVYADKAKGGRLHKDLRSQKPRRRRCLSGHDRRGQITNRRTIGERSKHIEARKKVGHWQGDTVIGPDHQQAIVTLVQRKSRYGKLFIVFNKSADQVSQANRHRPKSLGASVKTLTVNNGKEFVYHQQVDLTLGIKIYFADTCCSWQRGSNKKTSTVWCNNISQRNAV